MQAMGEASIVHSVPGANSKQLDMVTTADITGDYVSEDRAYASHGNMSGLQPNTTPFYGQLPYAMAQPTSASFGASHYGSMEAQDSMHKLDMSSVANALPDLSQGQMRHFHHQGGFYPGRGMPMSSTALPYASMPISSQGMPAYARNMSFAQAGQPGRHGYDFQQPPPYSTYPPYSPHMPMTAQGVPGHYMGMYTRPEVMSQGHMPPSYMMHGPVSTSEYSISPSNSVAIPSRTSFTDPTPSYPRGPPRKPKQSGHALWVGNLPPGTNVIDLKDHFSREATKDIESLFLISKSNCAFVNYRTEPACAAAMTRFHDSRFQGVRLVCRLRRGTTAATSTPELKPSSVKEDMASPLSEMTPESNPGPVVASSQSLSASPVKETVEPQEPLVASRIPEKFFIVKSLTLQDLDASVRNGVWATQSHNESALNTAYESADDVYLIFSANKSGEYFGYARMASPISGESTAPLSRTQPDTTEPIDGPKSIHTPATQWAPEGRIVDDSARGTIFWEVERPKTDSASSDNALPVPFNHEDSGSSMEAEESGKSKLGADWGKPFRIEWVSTNRLPFYRTRGLRNPWNANREVKIARDGTELEPSVGRRLVQMFHRATAPAMPQGMTPSHLPYNMS